MSSTVDAKNTAEADERCATIFKDIVASAKFQHDHQAEFLLGTLASLMKSRGRKREADVRANKYKSALDDVNARHDSMVQDLQIARYSALLREDELATLRQSYAKVTNSLSLLRSREDGIRTELSELRGAYKNRQDSMDAVMGLLDEVKRMQEKEKCINSRVESVLKVVWGDVEPSTHMAEINLNPGSKPSHSSEAPMISTMATDTAALHRMSSQESVAIPAPEGAIYDDDPWGHSPCASQQSQVDGIPGIPAPEVHSKLQPVAYSTPPTLQRGLPDKSVSREFHDKTPPSPWRRDDKIFGAQSKHSTSSADISLKQRNSNLSWLESDAPIVIGSGPKQSAPSSSKGSPEMSNDSHRRIFAPINPSWLLEPDNSGTKKRKSTDENLATAAPVKKAKLDNSGMLKPPLTKAAMIKPVQTKSILTKGVLPKGLVSSLAIKKGHGSESNRA